MVSDVQQSSSTTSLGYANAVRQFGATNLVSFQSNMLWSNTPGFWATTAQDARAHKWQYVARGAEIGLLFVPVAQEAEAFKLSLELHIAVVELLQASAEK
jgi:hypothetical protein